MARENAFAAWSRGLESLIVIRRQQDFFATASLGRLLWCFTGLVPARWNQLGLASFAGLEEGS